MKSFFRDSSADTREQLFVYSVWISMVLLAINYMVHYSTRIPLAEDWLMIEPLTGNEPNLASWVWSQVNEHRIPFPRLLYLILLLNAGGDFRIGGYFNIFLLGFIALSMILVARFIRGNQTSYTDAFFPLAWLHLGHSANLLMGWQVTQVAPTVIVSFFLLLFVVQKTFATPNVAVFSGISLVLLPLCGANGLLFVPFLACWFTICGVLNWRACKSGGGNSKIWISYFLTGSSFVAVGITGLYFTNYTPATWNPPSPSLTVSLVTGMKLLAYGWGPVLLYGIWTVPIVLTIILLLLTFATIANKFFGAQGIARYQSIGIFLFIGNLVLFSFVVGHSRAGWIPRFGLPPRYVIFAVPTLSAVFLISELYGNSIYRATIQRILCFGMILLLPFNILGGFYGFTDWYRSEAVAMENDIFSGYSPEVIASRWKNNHDGFVLWDVNEEEVLRKINMLREVGIKPFSQIQVAK